MKTLKKTLALVLVLAMACGMLVLPAAAFSDDADITYKTAVEVMTSLGAINGTDETKGTDGPFQPKGNVNRAQAAKLVAYTVLGPNVANGLTTGNTGFKDMNGYEWALPYIAWGVSEGIIDGYNDTQFGPGDDVTGYQFMKMLLCAIGYGKNSEFVGANWAINVATYGLSASINLDDGHVNEGNVNLNASATREEAALYCFNILDDARVIPDYAADGRFRGYTPDYTIGDLLTMYKAEIAYGTVDYDTSDLEFYLDGAYLIRYDSYGNEEHSTMSGVSDMPITAALADYGRAAEVWVRQIGNKWEAIASPNFSDELVATKTDSRYFGFTNGWIMSGDNYIGTAADPAYGSGVYDIDVYYNGEHIDIDTSNTGSNVAQRIDYAIDEVLNNGTASGAAGTSAGTKLGRGAEVYFYSNEDSKYIDTINIIDRRAYLLSGNATVSGTTVRLPGASSGYTTDNTVGYEGLKKDDVITVAPMSFNGTSIYFVEEATAVSGRVTAKNSNGSYKVDGTTNYFVHARADSQFTLTGSGNKIESYYNKDATIYLDSNNCIVYFKSDAESDPADYVYVIAQGTSGVMTEADIVRADGTRETIRVSTSLSSGLATGIIAELNTDDDTGNYYLTAVGATNAGYYKVTNAATFATGGTTTAGTGSTAAPTTSFVGNSETVLFMKEDTTYKVYVGVTNFPKFDKDVSSDGGKIDWAYTNSSGVTEAVYISNGEASTASGDSVFAYIYNTGSVGYTPKNGSTPAYYTFKALIKDSDGVYGKADINVTAGSRTTIINASNGEGLYKVTKNSDGLYVATLVDTETSSAMVGSSDGFSDTGYSKVDNYVISTGFSTGPVYSGAYSVKDGTQVFLVTGGTVDEESIGSLARDDDNYVVGVYTKDTSVAEVIFIKVN